jgi:hypothetical protein
LDISEDEPVAKAWLELPGRGDKHGLDSWAHRVDLSRTRPMSTEFRDLWNQFETILDVVLERFEVRYLKFHEVIDELLARESPTHDDVKKLRHSIPNNLVTPGYFFDNLKNPAWLSLLLKADFFKYPPELVHDKEKGSVSFPQWPESRYLARITAKAPETVCEIILQVPLTQNIFVHADFVDAALAMPPDLAARIVLSVKNWIESPYQLFLPDRVGALMAKLARGDEVDAAFDLANTLLDISPDPRASRENEIIYLSPRLHFDIWEYEDIIKRHVPDLVAADAEKSLILFCKLLEKAISFSHRQSDDGKEIRDYSSIWRPAIEDRGQHQRGPRELNDMLVTVIRDTADSMMQTNGKSVLNLLESQPYTVFKRIGLHLRNKWPDVDAAGIYGIILDSDYICEPEYKHDLFLLLKNRFWNLPDDIKQQYLSLLDKEVAQIRERLQKSETEERADQIARYWLYGKLYPIQESLSGEWWLRFVALQQEVGDNANPDVLSDVSVGWVGPTSPKTADELRAMDVAELVEYLKSWKPSGKWMSPTPEGLGRELSSIVSADPERYAGRASDFQGVPPTYIRHLVTGFREAKKQEKTFVWEPVLQLCQWVANQQIEIETGLSDSDADSKWGPARQAVADLMATGFQTEEGGIPFSERVAAWQIIAVIAEDSEPSAEYEAKYGGSNMSPMMLSINTVRGWAMHAVVRYAIWVRRHKEQEADDKNLAAIGFDIMPEVRELLERHLEPSYDRALAIRSVYGEKVPFFVWLDRKWAVENLGKIFPADESLRDLRNAAWQTYIVYAGLYTDVFEVLRTEYLRAINELGQDTTKNRESPAERLAEHLMAFYWHGQIDLKQQEGLLEKFYEKASISVKARALEFLGRSLCDTKETIEPEVLARLRQLLEYRLQAIRDSSSESASGELVPFGWWFSSQRFEDDWAIARLKEVLELAGMVEPDHMVVESLASLADRKPLESVDCLRLMVRGAKEHWRIYHWREKARIILSTALRAADAEPRQAAKDLVNQLGALGFFEFRDLLTSA